MSTFCLSVAVCVVLSTGCGPSAEQPIHPTPQAPQNSSRPNGTPTHDSHLTSGHQTMGASGSRSAETTNTPGGKLPSQSRVHRTQMPPTPKAAGRLSQQQIVLPYVARLASLKSQYLSALQTLYDEARNDYHQHLGTKRQIENKYAPKALALENSAQDDLNTALFSLRADLTRHGYPTESVNTLRQQYGAQLHQTIAQFGR